MPIIMSGQFMRPKKEAARYWIITCGMVFHLLPFFVVHCSAFAMVIVILGP
jgi:hypothetical protein